MQPYSPQPESVRPRRQIHPPRYLEDYDLTGGRRPSPPLLSSAALHQQAQGTEEMLQYMPNQLMEARPTSRAQTPYSQGELLLALGEDGFHPALQHDMDPMLPDLSRPSPLLSQIDHQLPTSPYHRPWERQQLQSPLVSTSQHSFQPVTEHVPQHFLHPASRHASPIPQLTLQRPYSAPVVQQPLAHSQPSINRLVQSPQTTGQQPYYPSSSQPMNTGQPIDRDQMLTDFLGNVMSELQIVKDQVASPFPFKPSPPSASIPLYGHSSTNPTNPYRPQPHQSFTHAPPSLQPSQPAFGGYSQPQMPPPRPAYAQPPLLAPQPRYPPQQLYPTHLVQVPTAYPPSQEKSYRGPKATIPNFVNKDPGEFTRLKRALGNLLPPDSTELFRYQILLDHLKLEEARLVADSYMNSPFPYSDTMAALTERYGQPHKLALKKIASVMDSADVRRGDTAAFERFALEIRALVGMLATLGPEGAVELRCGSHVDRLLSKLPAGMRAEFRHKMGRGQGMVFTLYDLSQWLQYEAWCQETPATNPDKGQKTAPKPERKREVKPTARFATVLHGANEVSKQPAADSAITSADAAQKKATSQAFCPYCNNNEHYLSQCTVFKAFTKDQMANWIKANHRCWRCARTHQAAQCTLKKPCSICKGKHLQILHEVNAKGASPKGPLSQVKSATETLYLDQPTDSKRVLLKVAKVLIRYQGKALETYAVLDDGSERTILLAAAALKLGMQGSEESLTLRTIRQDVQTLSGSTVSFQLSPANQPRKTYQIKAAFTAERLGLADHSYPAALQRKYKHLENLSLQPFERASPLLLIGADHPHLITPITPVRLGPSGGPAAVQTRLGWVLQGPVCLLQTQLQSPQCLFLSLSPAELELKRDVERLWQLDVLPYGCEKQVTRSREDQEAISCLEAKTTRVEMDGVLRYATPLLRKANTPCFQAPKEAVMPSLRSMERRLAKDPGKGEIYNAEVKKLVDSKVVTKLSSENTPTGESWYIPHFIVNHNGKDRIVFNCSFRYKGLNLNEALLPGPTLSPSLLGVLLRFRQHSVAISGDIRGMFYQVLLLPEDKPLLRFLWRDTRRDDPPDIYEWQVLPFGTTCSPCCATFALQRHVTSHSTAEEDVRFSVEKCFYVDNCLQSFRTSQEARHLLDKLRDLLASGGFDLRQWASNKPEVVSHLPPDARSAKLELWLSQDRAEARESTLGLSWFCDTDTLGFKHRPVSYDTPTMRNIYRVLATQYDPLGVLLPFTTRAKVIVQQLWDKHRDWDDPLLPEHLLQAWVEWESELQYLPQMVLPRCYLPSTLDNPQATHNIHIFCDASEKAYGSVAYLQSTDTDGSVHLAFLLARSRVAPRKQHSMPRLELCAALTGAQLASVLLKELTLPILGVTYWSDSTTVLHWLYSESCHFKVFVGTRVAEIQELTDLKSWRYVDSARNPADDVTRGKPLDQLLGPNRWIQGPQFLLQPPSEWPSNPVEPAREDDTELKKTVFCGLTLTLPPVTDGRKHSSWQDLLQAVAEELHGAAGLAGHPPADTFREAELLVLRRIQTDCFPEDYQLLQEGKTVTSSSRLLCLSPEFDHVTQLIRVGGRLRHVEGLDSDTIHPVVLDPSHPNTRLLIKAHEVGMVVMLVDPQVPRSSWQIGKVVKVFPGADGRVRTADVKIHDRVYTRPIARLIVLPEITDVEDNPNDPDPD